MFDFLKLKKEVSETTADIDANDVLSVKNKLKGMGHYKEPSWGMTNFTDREMFDGIRNFQKEKGLTVDGIMKPQGETENKINEGMKKQQQSGLKQITGSMSDMSRNYLDMRKDNVVGNDDYFHCKGNFESAQRGNFGEKISEYMGNMKEQVDYFRNRAKGLSAIDSYADYKSDKYINHLGRQQARTKLYSTAKDACKFKRKERTDEIY